MTTDASNWGEAMMKTWAESQKKYWDTLSGVAQQPAAPGFGGFGGFGAANPFAQNPFTANPFAANPFAANPFAANNFAANPFQGMPFPDLSTLQNPFSVSLEEWWNKVTPTTSGQLNDIAERFHEMGKTFMSMADGAFKSANTEQPGLAMEMWMSTIESMLQQWISQIQSNSDVFVPDLPGISGTTLNAWARFADSVAPWLNTSQGMLKEVAEGHLPGGLEMPGMGAAQEQFCRALSMPGLGYTREQQEKLQRLARHLIDYHEAMRAYKLAFAKTALKSMEALHERVKDMREKGETLESLRSLYDMWVDVSEEVYAQFAMTDEYQVVYGDLVNSLMRVRKDMNDMAEQQYQLMNLPTRSEIDTMQHRQQANRRENRKLQSQVSKLQAAVEKLQAQLDAGAAQAPAAPKTARKAKTVKAQEEPVQAEIPTPAAEDDLTMIKGIGPKMAEKLYAEGIKSFGQLAGMNEEVARQMDALLKAQGRLFRDNWIGQAKDLNK